MFKPGLWLWRRIQEARKRVKQANAGIGVRGGPSERRRVGVGFQRDVIQATGSFLGFAGLRDIRELRRHPFLSRNIGDF
jgi:hypothetical protein